ncbi:RNA recognition motif-containing protein [Besnoitia besnoiti]|uniref:RNA recognition motif-containing protein n=1 Tax=Besnoitia besnoiti TaxID=94643 RepID=A0A2A9M1Z6_BESBE|nr:RNA recognition motif-containing protein [Besnoitia besnoiti]PFH31989.1 RNA recognition motif-containing protein [Besnoitia besnoiti]
MTQSMLDMSLDDIVAAHRASADDSSSRGGRGRSGFGPTRRGASSFGGAGGSFSSSRGRGGRFGSSSWVGEDSWESGRYARGRRGGFGSPYAFEDRGGDRRAAPWAGARGAGARAARPQTAVVRVSNLDYSVLEEDLKELFSAVGEISKVWIDYDRTDRSKGTGGCVFRSVADAKRAIQTYEGRRIEGLPLRLELVPPRNPDSRRFSPSHASGPYSQESAFQRRGGRGANSWRGVAQNERLEPW